jgi:hypothetical protein
MKIDLDRKALVCLTVALTLLTAAPDATAQTSLEKHARRMERKLSKFRTGSFVQVDLRDRSESLGSLGSLSGETFQMTDADSNKLETLSYDDVAQVRKAKEYIGEGSEGRHRPRLLLPRLVTAAAAAAAVAVVEAVR